MQAPQWLKRCLGLLTAHSLWGTLARAVPNACRRLDRYRRRLCTPARRHCTACRQDRSSCRWFRCTPDCTRLRPHKGRRYGGIRRCRRRCPYPCRIARHRTTFLGARFPRTHKRHCRHSGPWCKRFDRGHTGSCSEDRVKVGKGPLLGCKPRRLLHTRAPRGGGDRRSAAKPVCFAGGAGVAVIARRSRLACLTRWQTDSTRVPCRLQRFGSSDSAGVS